MSLERNRFIQRKVVFYHGRYQQGAALLAVLIVALVLVILMSVASQTMQSRLTLAEDSKQQLQDLTEVQAKISELTYLVATQRITAAGISQGTSEQGLLRNEDEQWLLSIVGDEIRADGHQYQTELGLRYSVQNEAGMIPVNTSSQFWLKRWLQAYGYSAIEQVKYTDILADYADADNWRRPGGAERAFYTSQDLAPPANFLLQDCSELWRMVAWRALLIKHPSLLQQCSLSRSGRINVNAIPIHLWRTLWPNSADKIDAQRQNNRWFMLPADVLASEPALLNVSEDYYAALGGKVLVLTVSKNGVFKQLKVERGNGKVRPFTLRLASGDNR